MRPFLPELSYPFSGSWNHMISRCISKLCPLFGIFFGHKVGVTGKNVVREEWAIRSALTWPTLVSVCSILGLLRPLSMKQILHTIWLYTQISNLPLCLILECGPVQKLSLKWTGNPHRQRIIILIEHPWQNLSQKRLLLDASPVGH